MTIVPICIFLGIAAALKFDVEPSYEHYGSRGVCVKHRIPGNSLVTGFFKIAGDRSIKSGVLIYDNQGNQPYAQPDLTGEARFSFRSLDVPTEYDFCSRALPKAGGANIASLPKIPTELVVKYDYDLFDEKLAQDFKLKPIETEFFQLEEVIRRIADELNHSVKNEEMLRDTNESTLERVNIFSALSIVILVGLGIWQLIYLKRFFRNKRLI